MFTRIRHLSFLPEGSALIAERTGSLRLLRGGSLSLPIPSLPKVHAEGPGGLLDVALSPGFAQDRLVYLSYAEAGDGKSGTAVGRGRLCSGRTPGKVRRPWRYRGWRQTVQAIKAQDSRKATPPSGVMAPRMRVPVPASRYRLPLKSTMPANMSQPATGSRPEV